MPLGGFPTEENRLESENWKFSFTAKIYLPVFSSLFKNHCPGVLMEPPQKIYIPDKAKNIHSIQPQNFLLGTYSMEMCLSCK